MLYPVLLDMEEIIPGCGLRGFYQLGGLGGQTRKNKEFGDIRFFSSHNLLMCGRVHFDSRHSRMLSAVIHDVYIAAVHWEDD